MNIQYLIISFGLYSFIGWIIEVIYRSREQKKLVNPGFLYGPFLPIYGFGAVLVIYLHKYMSAANIPIFEPSDASDSAAVTASQ